MFVVVVCTINDFPLNISLFARSYFPNQRLRFVYFVTLQIFKYIFSNVRFIGVKNLIFSSFVQNRLDTPTVYHGSSSDGILYSCLYKKVYLMIQSLPIMKITTSHHTLDLPHHRHHQFIGIQNVPLKHTQRCSRNAIFSFRNINNLTFKVSLHAFNAFAYVNASKSRYFSKKPQ